MNIAQPFTEGRQKRMALVSELKKYGRFYDEKKREELMMAYLDAARMDHPFEFICGLDRKLSPPLVEAALGELVYVPFKSKNRAHYLFKTMEAKEWLRVFVTKNGTREDLKGLTWGKRYGINGWKPVYESLEQEVDDD